MRLYAGDVRVHVFFFNDTATTEIYTLSLHDALPIFRVVLFTERLATLRWLRRTLPAALKLPEEAFAVLHGGLQDTEQLEVVEDRKSTRLNSSHANISYAVFCLKKKKYNRRRIPLHTT